MPLDEAEVAGLLKELWPEWLENRDQSKEWEDWALGRQKLPTIPDTATYEYRELQRKSITPWLGLLVQSLAQALDVEGYRTSTDDDSALWQVWQANGMDSKQTGLYEAALTTGVAYMTVLPTATARGRRPLGMPEWRPYSSAEMTAFYESAFDEWPVYAVAAERAPRWQEREVGESVWRVTLFDATHVYFVTHSTRGTGWLSQLDDVRQHGLNRPPVIRYVNRQTITGRAIGEVEPYIAAASRIDQDVFDRLVVQRFGAWRVRYATGLVNPANDQTLSEEERKARLKEQELMLKAGDILTSDSPDTKFGDLPASEMDGHLKAAIEDIRMLASVSQTPPQLLTGDISNVSAEALAAIEASFNRKVEQRKQNFGESHEQAFALSASIMNIDVDPSAQVRWRDMESRSLAQTADALGKVAQMLEVPVEVLWDHLPFLTDQDRERALQQRQQMDAIGRLFADLQLPEDTESEQGAVTANGNNS